jgi:hypothetical protein
MAGTPFSGLDGSGDIGTVDISRPLLVGRSGCRRGRPGACSLCRKGILSHSASNPRQQRCGPGIRGTGLRNIFGKQRRDPCLTHEILRTS